MHFKFKSQNEQMKTNGHLQNHLISRFSTLKIATIRGHLRRESNRLFITTSTTILRLLVQLAAEIMQRQHLNLWVHILTTSRTSCPTIILIVMRLIRKVQKNTPIQKDNVSNFNAMIIICFGLSNIFQLEIYCPVWYLNTWLLWDLIGHFDS